MEKVYQRQRASARTCSAARNNEQEKPLFSLKKLVVQTIASIIVFAFVYSMQFAHTPFGDAVINEASYTVNYTVDFQELYKSSREVLSYLKEGIEQGKIYINNTVIEVQNPNVADNQKDNDIQTTSYDLNKQSGEPQ